MAKALWLRRCNRHWRVAAAVARRTGAGVRFSRVGVRGSQAAVPKMMRRSRALRKSGAASVAAHPCRFG